jgi:signal peptidase I
VKWDEDEGAVTRASERRLEPARPPADGCTRRDGGPLPASGQDETADELRARIRQLEGLVALGVAWVLKRSAASAASGPSEASGPGASGEGQDLACLEAEIRRLELVIEALADLEARRQHGQAPETALRHALPAPPDHSASTNGSLPPERSGDQQRGIQASSALDDALPARPGVERGPLAGPTPPAWRLAVASRARRWGSEAFQFVLVLVVGFLAFRSTIQTFRVDGPSMLPTFQSGQVLLINRAAYFHVDGTPLESIVPATHQGSIAFVFGGVKRGDVVVFRAPTQRNTDYIKRVIGLPGDSIAFRGGQVLVNGRPLGEPYANHGDDPLETYPNDAAPVTVPDGMYFVMGDNRPESFDSREGWLLPIENVVGRAWLSVWPPGAWGVVGRWSATV